MKRSILAVSVAFLLAPAGFAASSKPCTVAASESLLTTLVKQAPGLRTGVLRLALDATGCAEERGLVKRRDLLTVIDYSLPSSQPRLFTFDLNARKLLFRELVAHGKSSGGNLANFFSNSPGSLATSLGLFVTADPYIGGNGYSLRLKGLEEGVNDMAWDRAVVMHGASYVSRA
ncbi:MAG: L,D-transpeptidase catalytic domain protein, partial [Acidobacteria bacterium]|nr:L,D-transpeptidase catalytic domain protein [Acidobacteriota bacterium]